MTGTMNPDPRSQAPMSRSEEFSAGLRAQAERDNWDPGEVESMERERTRSRGQ